jgi:hypothetical protein
MPQPAVTIAAVPRSRALRRDTRDIRRAGDFLTLSTILPVAVSIEASRVGCFDVAVAGETRPAHENDFGRVRSRSRQFEFYGLASKGPQPISPGTVRAR